jgi:methylmalonyl-CoA/ethylmalonyl-CoA epimerase
MKIDHICFSVPNINEGIVFWESVFGYRQMTQIIENTRQKVRVAFLSKDDGLLIKLIEPVDKNKSEKSPNLRGGGFHHICFKCSDIESEIDSLKKKGLILLVPPQPGEAFNNKEIAFLLARNGLNIELIDTEEKSGKIDEI